MKILWIQSFFVCAISIRDQRLNALLFQHISNRDCPPRLHPSSHTILPNLHAFSLTTLYRAMKLLLQAGADPNVRDEYSTPFKIAGKKKMRLIDGTSLYRSITGCFSYIGNKIKLCVIIRLHFFHINFCASWNTPISYHSFFPNLGNRKKLITNR